MSTFILFMIIAALLLAGTIIFQVLAWKRGETIHWVLTFVIEVIGNFMYFMLMFYFNSEASAAREQLHGAIESGPPYSKFAVVCLMLALLFIGLLLISIVLAIGHHALKDRGEL